MSNGIKITGKMIGSLKGMEDALKREESKALMDSLPPGHPLLQQAQQIMQETNSSDLSDIPETHPVKIQIKEARERLNDQQVKEFEQNKQVKIRKAKKIEQVNSQKIKRAKEDNKEDYKNAVREINQETDLVINKMDQLLGSLNSKAQFFQEDPFEAMKLKRLIQTIEATKRGILNNKIKNIVY